MNYSNFKYSLLFILVPFITTKPLNAQVAIGKVGIDDGAIFQLESENKGLMIPNVALSSRNDIITVNPNRVEGMMVYNTTASGSGLTSVSPGFYYWDGSEWRRLFNDGFTVQYMQDNVVKARNNDDTYTFPGLDQTIVAPYTGTYQIYVIAHYAANSPDNTNYESVGYAEVMLEIDDVKVASAFVTSSSKRTPSNFLALAQQTSIIYNVDLVEGQNYNFKVRGRQWYQRNMSNSGLLGLPSGRGGAFGIQTSSYNGNSSPTGTNNNDAQRGVLTITLLRQF